MKQQVLYILLLLILFGCLDPIDFDTEFPDNLIVVDGTFTDSEETDQVKLSFAIDYGKQSFVAIKGANLSIYDDTGLSESLVEMEEGIYEFQKEIVKGEVGKTYYLEIILKDGRTYQSQPELLQEAPTIDSFSYEIKNVEFANDFGNVVSAFNFNLFVQSTINTENNTNFLRWEVEHVYAFEQPYLYYIPFSMSVVCYVKEILDPQLITILDGQGFAAAANIKEQVATKEMDYTFAYAQSYRVSQYNLSEEAYAYWNNINKISNLVGNIFDAPPAPVKGNIRRIDDESELVLGYFGVAGVKRSTIFITRGDVRDQFRPISYCGTDPRNPAERLPPPCYGCTIIDNSSLKRPDYW